MNAAAPAEVELLVTQIGPWLLGMDTRDIARIERQTEAADEWRLEDIVGVDDERRPGEGRVLVLTGETQNERAWVGAAVVAKRLPIDVLRPVPPLLRGCGAPPWWLGVAFPDAEAAVLLIDLRQALRWLAARREA